MRSTTAAGVLAAMTLVGLVAGNLAFAVVMVGLAGVVLADFTTVLSRAGPRPVTLAAAVPGIGLPAAVALRPQGGWDAVPDFVAGGMLAAFVVVLIFGRRRGVTAALGATALVGLVVGLGASGLLLLRSLPQGLVWVLGVIAVVAAVDACRQLAATRADALRAGLATVAVALAAGGVLTVAARPPFALTTSAAVTALALLAVGAAGLLREAIDDALAATRADAPASAPWQGAPSGVLTSAAMPVLLAAPAVYAVARLVTL